MKLPLELHEVEIAGRRWQIEAVRDQDALLAAAEAFAHPPYGLLLWESAVALGHLLARLGRPQLEGRKVLDLGCGVGLPGLVAAGLGAVVVAADHEPLALGVASANARRNGIPPLRQIAADWRTWDLAERFDIILGADLGYETAMHGPLRRILTGNLAVGGRLLLADPGRQQMLELLADLDAADGFEIGLDTTLVPDAAGLPHRPPVLVTLATATRRALP